MKELKTLEDALFETDCPICYEQLEWEMVAKSGDFPIWGASCCGKDYTMTVERVLIESE